MFNIVYRCNNSDENKEFLDDGLEAYNYSKNKWLTPSMYENEIIKFGIYAYLDCEIIGGVWGFIDEGYWFYVDLLFVDEKYRKKNVGTTLMKKVEEFAYQNKCVGIRTETWDFQARCFYEKLGFTVYGQLENHPPFATDFYLKKVLITKDSDFPVPIQ